MAKMKMTITNCHPSQKPIQRNAISKQNKHGLLKR